MVGTHPAPRALALVGMPGAGKTLCAHHLERRGYFQFRFGGIIVNEVERRGLELNQTNERIVREDLRANEGMDAIAKRALPHLKSALADRQHLVIDGLYGFSEYRTLNRELGTDMIVVAVISERRLRYQRLAQRPERPLTHAEAQERDFREIEYLEKGGPIAIADFTLLNNTTPEALLTALDDLVAELAFVP